MKIVDTLKKTAVAGLAGLILATGAGCSSENDAVKAASRAGWSDVQVTDSSYILNLTCEEGEMAYRITGKNPKGDQTSATVCCGYTTPFKGCTIRYE